MKHTHLFPCVLLGILLSCVACDDLSIPADSLTTDGITQGKIVYDTIPGMRAPSADTIDVAEAMRIGLELPSGSTSQNSYYIIGYVKGFYQPFDANYGNISPTLTNDLNNRSFICYRLKSFKNQAFTSAEQLQIGDIIVVYGQIMNRYGAPQLSQGGWLVTSNNPLSGYKPAPRVALSETFAESLGSFAIVNHKAASDAVWQFVAGNDGANGFARALAKFNDASEEAESWLVSPVLNLNDYKQAIELTFSHYYIGATDRDAQLRVMITTNGTDWAPLTLTDDMWNNGRQKRFVTATIDLSAYKSANTQIAFAYTSTADNAPTWAIQNVRIGEPLEE